MSQDFIGVYTTDVSYSFDTLKKYFLLSFSLKGLAAQSKEYPNKGSFKVFFS